MPGPIGVYISGPKPEVRCQLCDFRQVCDTEDEADELCYSHVVANHPEITEP